MKKLFTVILALSLCCIPSYAHIWEGGSGDFISEGLDFGNGGSGGWTPDPLDPNVTHYVISFKDNDQTTNLFSSMELNENTIVDLSVFVPSDRTGYTFNGWEDSNSDPITSVTMTSDITVYASWNINSYNLTLTDDSGTNVIPKAYGAAITETPTARTGYSAWWVPTLPSTMPASNLSATAEYSNVTKNLITVVDGVSTTTAYYVGQPIEMTDPSKAGYAFVEWNPALPAVMPNEDLTVTAVFTQTYYTVYYRNTDQSIYSSQVYAYLDEIVEPTEPTYANDYFWDWDSLPDEMPPATITVNAVTFPKTTAVYGLEVDLDAVASPSAYTYIYDSVGMNPINVSLDGTVNNFDSSATSWKSFINQYVKPCMLKLDGTVDYYLDPEDQSLRADGVTASDISNANYEGNAMVEFKKLWSNAKRIRGTRKYRLIISPNEIPDITFAEAFRREDGTYADYAYYGMFEASYNTTAQRTTSLAAGNLDSTSNLYTVRSRAQNNGNGWDFTYLALTEHVYKILAMTSKTVEPIGILFHAKHVSTSTSTSNTNKSDGVGHGCFYVQGNTNTTGLIKTLWIVGFYGERADINNGILYQNEKIKYKNPPYPAEQSNTDFVQIYDLSTDSVYSGSQNEIYWTRLSFYKGVGFASKFSTSRPTSNVIHSGNDGYFLHLIDSSHRKNGFMRPYLFQPSRYSTAYKPVSVSYIHLGYSTDTSIPGGGISLGYRLSYIQPSPSRGAKSTLYPSKEELLKLVDMKEESYATPSSDIGETK